MTDFYDTDHVFDSCSLADRLKTVGAFAFIVGMAVTAVAIVLSM